MFKKKLHYVKVVGERNPFIVGRIVGILDYLSKGGTEAHFTDKENSNILYIPIMVTDFRFSNIMGYLTAKYKDSRLVKLEFC
jgi:hypothetical protein